MFNQVHLFKIAIHLTFWIFICNIINACKWWIYNLRVLVYIKIYFNKIIYKFKKTI